MTCIRVRIDRLVLPAGMASDAPATQEAIRSAIAAQLGGAGGLASESRSIDRLQVRSADAKPAPLGAAVGKAVAGGLVS